MQVLAFLKAWVSPTFDVVVNVFDRGDADGGRWLLPHSTCGNQLLAAGAGCEGL